MIPVLFITHNRLTYTQVALDALLRSTGIKVYIIDNNSTDGTREWLQAHPYRYAWISIFNPTNAGIAGAMNQFMELTGHAQFVGKVDNDTVVPVDWAQKLRDILITYSLDIVQARHHIIAATNPAGWEGFVRHMPVISPGIYINHFVGGSGIMIRRKFLKTIPVTEWILGGWRQFQREHPHLRKAFTDHVQIQLLDEHGYVDYPQYYKQTKRLL